MAFVRQQLHDESRSTPSCGRRCAAPSGSHVLAGMGTWWRPHLPRPGGGFSGPTLGRRSSEPCRRESTSRPTLFATPRHATGWHPVSPSMWFPGGSATPACKLPSSTWKSCLIRWLTSNEYHSSSPDAQLLCLLLVITLGVSATLRSVPAIVYGGTGDYDRSPRTDYPCDRSVTPRGRLREQCPDSSGIRRGAARHFA